MISLVSSPLALALFFLLSPMQTRTQAGTTFTKLLETQQDDIWDRLNLNVFPKSAKVGQTPVEPVFALKAPSLPNLFAVPVSFSDENSRTSQQCGILFLTYEGETYYSPIVGPDLNSTWSCGDPEAAGATKDPGPQPRLIFIFKIWAADGQGSDTPFVLAWDARASRYELDRTATNVVWTDPSSRGTIAATRAILERKLPKSK